MENLRHKETLKILNVYYIPTNAQISSVDLYQITPTCFGVNTPSSGNLQVVLAMLAVVMITALAEIMNIALAEVMNVAITLAEVMNIALAEVMNIAIAKVMNMTLSKVMTLANTTCKLPEDGVLTPKHVGVI